MSPFSHNLNETAKTSDCSATLFFAFIGERKKLSFLSPSSGPMGSSDINMNQCGESPLVEGCSPIRSCSPLQTHPVNRGCIWASPTLMSHVFHPNLQDKDRIHFKEPLPTIDLDASSTRNCEREGFKAVGCEFEDSLAVAEQMDQDMLVVKDMGALTETGNENEIFSGKESCGWVPEEDTVSSVRLISSMTSSMPNAESTHMFVSLLAEGSITPCEVSMQVSMHFQLTSIPAASFINDIKVSCSNIVLTKLPQPEWWLQLLLLLYLCVAFTYLSKPFNYVEYRICFSHLQKHCKAYF